MATHGPFRRLPHPARLQCRVRGSGRAGGSRRGGPRCGVPAHGSNRVTRRGTDRRTNDSPQASGQPHPRRHLPATGLRSQRHRHLASRALYATDPVREQRRHLPAAHGHLCADCCWAVADGAAARRWPESTGRPDLHELGGLRGRGARSRGHDRLLAGGCAVRRRLADVVPRRGLRRRCGTPDRPPLRGPS